VLAATVASWFALAAPPTSLAATPRSCGSFQAGGMRLHVSIRRGRVSCTTARTVLRAFFAGKGKMHGPAFGPAALQYWTVYGWNCGHGTGGGACLRDGTNYRNARDYIWAVV
jgi:hypothetical protein